MVYAFLLLEKNGTDELQLSTDASTEQQAKEFLIQKYGGYLLSVYDWTLITPTK